MAKASQFSDMASLTDNDFEIFGLPCRFELDKTGLTNAYLKLQNQTHPDRHANASAGEKRLAMQWATRVNEAYGRLKDPLERAIYWCGLQGQDARAHQVALPAELLMQQMQWREALDETQEAQALQTLLQQVTQTRKDLLTQLGLEIDDEHDATAAIKTTQALMFVEKFLHEVTRKLEKLEDAA